MHCDANVLVCQESNAPISWGSFAQGRFAEDSDYLTVTLVPAVTGAVPGVAVVEDVPEVEDEEELPAGVGAELSAPPLELELLSAAIFALRSSTTFFAASTSSFFALIESCSDCRLAAVPVSDE